MSVFTLYVKIGGDFSLYFDIKSIPMLKSRSRAQFRLSGGIEYITAIFCLEPSTKIRNFAPSCLPKGSKRIAAISVCVWEEGGRG